MELAANRVQERETPNFTHYFRLNLRLFNLKGSGYRVYGIWYMVKGSGFQGLGFRVCVLGISRKMKYASNQAEIRRTIRHFPVTFC